MTTVTDQDPLKLEHGADRSRAVAPALAGLVAPLFPAGLPFRLRAWDGSTAGSKDGPTVVVTSRAALRRLSWAPGELGLARSFVAGEIDVEGDLTDGLRDGLREVWQALDASSGRASGAGSGGLRRARRVLGALGLLVRLGAAGPPPPRPRSEARVHGRLHSRGRDRAVVEHHYDLSNAFYALVLDETMAYSCAYFADDDPSRTLADAQRDKFELVCTKLALGPGRRLLDVGCGWGSLTLHAALHHDTEVTAVTLSVEQASHVREQVARRGLGDRVEVLLCDYREIPDGAFDAVASIEMGEHVGRDGYPAFARALAGHLRPGGRALVQQMSRPERSPGGGPFIERYIAPDMHMRPVDQTVQLLEQAGLEVHDVQALREHYARTIWCWYEALCRRAEEATSLVGPEVVRVWRLYLAGIALGFERGRSGVDQILAVRPLAHGPSGVGLGERLRG